MDPYRDDELFRNEKAKNDLEETSRSERNDLGTSIDHVLSTAEHREVIRKAGFDPDNKTVLAEAKDKIVSLGLAAKVKKYLVFAHRNWAAFVAAGIIGGALITADVNTQPNYAGEVPASSHIPTAAMFFEPPGLSSAPIECQGHHNDCAPNYSQDLPHDVFFVDMSNSLQERIDAVRESLQESAYSSPREGFQQSCYSGPLNTHGVGECRAGVQSFEDGQWSRCYGEVLPREEVRWLIRNGLDDDCNGCPDNGYDADGICFLSTRSTGKFCEFTYQCELDEICLDARCIVLLR